MRTHTHLRTTSRPNTNDPLEIEKEKRKKKKKLLSHRTVISPHLRIEHIQGFTGSHWMPPSVECVCGIAPAAAMVEELE
jgi:hypothetical protein